MCLLTWAASKLFLKKAWIWFKTYWYVPAVLAYTFVLWILFRRNASAALEVLATSQKSYEEQLDALKKSHAEEIQKRDRALVQYEEILNVLEMEHAERKEELSAEKKEKIKEHVKRFEDDPAGLAKILEEKFGIKYTPMESANE